jgi:hypothetical protein
MTDLQISDAILRRIGDQTANDSSRVDSAPTGDGGYILMRGDKVMGTLFVRRGCAVVKLDGYETCTVPAIGGTQLTETDTDAIAVFITEVASRR